MRAAENDLYFLAESKAGFPLVSGISELLHQHWKRQLMDDKAKLKKQLKYYIPAKLAYTEHDDIKNKLQGLAEIRAFLDSDIPALLLLGDSGVGKSLFCQSVVHNMWPTPGEWLPLFIHLPLLNIHPGFVFETYLREQCRLSFEQIDLLKERKIKLLVIFDAYDEMQDSYRGKNIYKELNLHHFEVKVILSCRTEALVNYHSAEQLGIFTPTKVGTKAIAIERRYVQFFDAEQIPEYIERWKLLKQESWKLRKPNKLVNLEINYVEEINKLPGLAVMITNPFILWAVMKVLPYLLRDYANHPTLERYDQTRKALFDRFTQFWFERQRDKQDWNQQLDGAWQATIIEDYRNYCQKLADYMWQKNMTHLIYEPQQDAKMQLPSLDSPQYASNENTLLKNFFANEGNFENIPGRPLRIIRQGALLRVFSGNTYTFLHHSLIEYFSATRLFYSAIHKATIILGLEINARIFTNDSEKILLAVDYISQYPEFEKILWDIVYESKHEERIATGAANAISILAAANKVFAGKDLRNIRIRYANLTGVNFEGTDLRDADLRDTNLTQTWLSNAKLSGTCLDNIQLDEFFCEQLDCGVRACAFSHCGGYYVAMTAKSFYIYDTATHKQRFKQTLLFNKLTQNEFTSLTVSSASDYILLGSLKGRVYLFSFPDGRYFGRWDAHTEKASASIQCRDGSSWLDYLKRRDIPLRQMVGAVVLTKDGAQALSVGQDSLVKSWNCGDGQLRGYFDTKLNDVTTMALNNDESWILTASFSGQIKRWDAKTLKCLAAWSVLSDGLTQFALSADNKWILAQTHHFELMRQNALSGECISNWQSTTMKATAMSISADQTWVVVGSFGQVDRFNCVSGQIERTWGGYDGEVGALAISPNGAKILSGTIDGRLISWRSHANGYMAGSSIILKSKINIVYRDYCASFGIHCDDVTAITRNNRILLCVSDIHESRERQFRGDFYTEYVRYNLFHLCNIEEGCCIEKWEEEIESRRVITACALSPDSRWMILGDNYANIEIRTTSKRKIVRKYPLTYYATEIQWSQEDPTMISIKMSDGTVSTWTFQEATASLSLRWRNKAWGLNVNNTDFSGVHGLCERQTTLFSQQGARVQVSTKQSTDVLAQRNNWARYVIGETRRSLFDSTQILSPHIVVITVARSSSGEGSQHAFMLIESVEEVSPGESYYRIRRIDFVLELRHWALPKGASKPHPTDTFGQGLIEIADKSFAEVQLLAKDLYHRSETVDFSVGTKLLENIYEDKRRRLAYCKMGSSQLYGFFTLREAVEHHNCLSWIRKHLTDETIKVNLLQGRLLDIFAEDPREKLVPEPRKIML